MPQDHVPGQGWRLSVQAVRARVSTLRSCNRLEDLQCPLTFSQVLLPTRKQRKDARDLPSRPVGEQQPNADSRGRLRAVPSGQCVRRWTCASSRVRAWHALAGKGGGILLSVHGGHLSTAHQCDQLQHL